MAIDFGKENGKLILCYTPAMGNDDIIKRLSYEKNVQIKRTFNVTKEILYEDSKQEDWDETLRFCIGQVGENYTQFAERTKLNEPRARCLLGLETRRFTTDAALRRRRKQSRF